MNRILISFFAIVLFSKSSFSQVNSDREANEVLSWVVENPQIETDSVFKEKLVSIFKWQALNHPQVQMRVTGISEFMNAARNYKFFEEITMIYMLSENMNQINGESSKIESAFLALNNVLSFYRKLVQINPSYGNSVLEKYARLSNKELRQKIKHLKK